MIRIALATLCVSTLASFAAPVDAAPATGELVVVISPTAGSVLLGDSLDITISVTNTSDRPRADLVVHLDIIDPRGSASVDPEDWTATLNRPLGVLDPGAADTVDWNIRPIAPGTFSVYAVAISPRTTDVATSEVLTVDVADRRSLDPGGILPVAIGVPALIGALLLARTLVTKRSRRPTTV